jgi:DNA repair photolyase
MIALSGNTDCYQPVERQLELTRRCLAVLCAFRNPVGVITKSALVARDIDLLGELAAVGAAQVHVSLTSLDPDLARRLEPRAAQPAKRLAAVAALAAAGIPTGVMIAPVIPGLNDEELPRLVAAAAEAGATTAGWTLLRLPTPVDQLFSDWLETHFPARKQRVLNRIRDCRGGAVSEARFGHRMRGGGAYAAHLDGLFRHAVKQHQLDRPLPGLSTAAFRQAPHAGEQLSLC